jgi:hypothetical protein
VSTHTVATEAEALDAVVRAEEGDTIVALSAEAAALARRTRRYLFVEGPIAPAPPAVENRRPRRRNRWVM